MKPSYWLLPKVIALTIAVSAWISPASADIEPYLKTHTQPGSEVSSAVNIGMETLPLLLSDTTHAEELGFTEEDARSAKAQVDPTPFVVFQVGLDQLRGWNGSNPEALPQFANKLLFPIYVGSRVNVKSSLTVRFFEKDKVWKVARWGSPALIHELVIKRNTVAPKGFLVTVPGLNRNYFGYLSGVQLMLIPLETDRFFPAGKQLRAVEVFKRLSAEAKSADGSPR